MTTLTRKCRGQSKSYLKLSMCDNCSTPFLRYFSSCRPWSTGLFSKALLINDFCYNYKFQTRSSVGLNANL